jgi:hypothetical protein
MQANAPPIHHGEMKEKFLLCNNEIQNMGHISYFFTS